MSGKRTKRWGLRDLWRETRANLSYMDILVTCILALVLMGLVSFSQALRQDAETRAIHWQENGSYVWVVEAVPADDGVTATIDSAACLAASGAGIRNTAFIASDLGGWRSFPVADEIPAKLVSPDLLKIFGIDTVISRVSIGAELARTGMAGVGQTFWSGDGREIRVGHEVERHTALEAINSYILIPAGADVEATQCFVQVSPAVGETEIKQVLHARFSGADVAIVPFRDSTADVPPDHYLHLYLKAGVPAIFGAACGIVILMSLLLSRKELATYLLVGADRPGVALMWLMRQSLSLGVSSGIAIAGGWVIQALHPGEADLRIVMASQMDVLIALLTALFFCTVCIAVVIPRHPIAAIR